MVWSILSLHLLHVIVGPERSESLAEIDCKMKLVTSSCGLGLILNIFLTFKKQLFISAHLRQATHMTNTQPLVFHLYN